MTVPAVSPAPRSYRAEELPAVADLLPTVVFDPRVHIRFDLDPERLQSCGQCPLVEDNDAVHLVTHRTTPDGTDWPTGACGNYCLHTRLHELLDRGLYERAVYAITVHLSADWAPDTDKAAA